jgi:hypothetical protein
MLLRQADKPADQQAAWPSRNAIVELAVPARMRQSGGLRRMRTNDLPKRMYTFAPCYRAKSARHSRRAPSQGGNIRNLGLYQAALRDRFHTTHIMHAIHAPSGMLVTGKMASSGLFGR